MIAFKKYWLLCLAAFAVACGGSDDGSGDEPGPGGGDYVPYDPPATIDPGNVFKVCVFSTLSDEKLFEGRDQSVVSDFINAYSGQKPLVYMLERSDSKTGSTLPHVNIAFKSKCYAFFAQHTATADEVKGTGIVTKYVISDYDGLIGNGLRISGCLVPAPLSPATQVYLYTTRLENLDQAKELVAKRGSALQYNGIVVGSIRNTIAEETVTYLKKNFKNYRIAFARSTATDYDLFVLTPVDFVCREIEPAEKVNYPYYTVSIEKLK